MYLRDLIVIKKGRVMEHKNIFGNKRGFKMLEKIIYFFRIRPRCNCRGFCVLCRFYKKCSYEMGVQKYCEKKLRN